MYEPDQLTPDELEAHLIRGLNMMRSGNVPDDWAREGLRKMTLAADRMLEDGQEEQVAVHKAFCLLAVELSKGRDAERAEESGRN